MPAITANGITIEYEEFGNKEHPAIILVMGLGSQLTAWPDGFCSGLAERGFRVIRFDNRDVGLSSKMNGQKPPHIVVQMLMSKLGVKLKMPYTLDDMALDTVGLMDALEIEAAHIAGASMGGMIVQIMAARYKERVKSLTCLITTSGNPRMPGPTKKVIKKILQKPKGSDKETWINYYFDLFTIIGTSGTDPEQLRENMRKRVERCLYPQGTARQLAAINHNGSRVEMLKEIEAPTLVVSGSADPMVPYQGGQDLAANVKDARFELIEGMGHDLPDSLIPRMVDLVANHAKGA